MTIIFASPRARLRRAPVLAVLVAALLTPAAAEAAVTTFGSDLRGTVTVDNGCEQISCTRLLFSVNGTELVSPVDGVVVRWRAVGTGDARLRLMQRDGATWRPRASGPLQSFPLGGGSGEWPVRIPVHAGDFLAVDGEIGHGVFMAARCDCADPRYPGTAVSHFFLPRMQDADVRAYDATRTGLEALVNADVEPDADGDGYGDDSQDCDPADPTRNVSCEAAAPGPAGPLPAGSPPAAPAPATPVPPPATGAPAARRRCVIPDLRGRTVRRASGALRAAGCRLGAVKAIRAGRGRRGRITGQFPRAGRAVAAGTRVRVRVGR